MIRSPIDGAPYPCHLFVPRPRLRQCGRGTSSSSLAGPPTGSYRRPVPGLPPTTRRPTPGQRCLPRRLTLHRIQTARQARPTSAPMVSPSGPELQSCWSAAANLTSKVPAPTASPGHLPAKPDCFPPGSDGTGSSHGGTLERLNAHGWGSQETLQLAVAGRSPMMTESAASKPRSAGSPTGPSRAVAVGRHQDHRIDGAREVHTACCDDR